VKTAKHFRNMDLSSSGKCCVKTSGSKQLVWAFEDGLNSEPLLSADSAGLIYNLLLFFCGQFFWL
jgi:hypothetical protein